MTGEATAVSGDDQLGVGESVGDRDLDGPQAEPETVRTNITIPVEAHKALTALKVLERKDFGELLADSSLADLVERVKRVREIVGP